MPQTGSKSDKAYYTHLSCASTEAISIAESSGVLVGKYGATGAAWRKSPHKLEKCKFQMHSQFCHHNFPQIEKRCKNPKRYQRGSSTQSAALTFKTLAILTTAASQSILPKQCGEIEEHNSWIATVSGAYKASEDHIRKSLTPLQTTKIFMADKIPPPLYNFSGSTHLNQERNLAQGRIRSNGQRRKTYGSAQPHGKLRPRKHDSRLWSLNLADIQQDYAN